MFTKTHAPTLSRPFVQSSSRPKSQWRRLASAASAFATLVVSTLVPATVSAQQAESTHRSGHNVAVIDVAYIFKNLSAIKEQVSRIEGELKRYDAEIKQKQETLKQSIAQLKTLKGGTVDYARKEESVATLESKLRLDMARKQKELRNAEAKIYYDNYQRIAAAVKAIASHNHINLVLRFNGEDMNLEQGDSVARGVMKNVVYHDSAINMTKMVMRYLEQQTNTSQVATGGSSDSATKR